MLEIPHRLMMSPLQALGDPELGHIFVEFSNVLRGMQFISLNLKTYK
jgi:hypothetical protein